MPFRPANLVHTDEANPVESTGSLVEDGSVEPRTRSSAGEHPLHTGRVAGSIPAASTIRYLYFILAPESRRMKIGIAKDPRQRLAALQTGNCEPLMLLGTIETDASEARPFERELHDCWAAWHIRGEWFHAIPELIQFAQEARDPPPPLTPEEMAPRRPKVPEGVEAPKGNSRVARMKRYLLARGLER